MKPEIEMVHAIEKYILVEFIIKQQVTREAAAYNCDDRRGPVTHERDSALGFENEKYMEHILKLQINGHDLT